MDIDIANPGQFDDAPEAIDVRGNAAYIDTPTANDLRLQVEDDNDDLTSEEEDDDSLLDEDDFYESNRVEDEDWEIAERDFTKQYNRLRQHVAVKSGNAQGVASTIHHGYSVASLPAVNIPKAVKATKPATALPTASAKDRTTSQMEAYAQKYTSRLAKIDVPYTMGVGVNRKGPSAHANVKDKSDRATNEQVLDPRTRLILFKMIGRGLVEEVNGCVSTGKEANVYHASTPEKAHLALKIYKTSILVFKDRSKYVTGEYRFRRGYSRNPRKMVRLWAEKEMRNLKRLRAAGIECPEPLEVRENVLAMAFIGTEGWASPRLKDAELSAEQLTPLYADLLSIVRTIFHTCRLVHADLSEYNILYHAGRLCIIDVSQSVEHDHPSAFDFLRSDIRNMEEFFGRGGVQTLGIRKAFEYVTKETLSEDPTETEREVLKRWLVERELHRDQDEEGSANDQSKEDAVHEDQVFMRSYIPRTLNEVYDPERDVDRLTRGGGKDLIYSETIGVVRPTEGGDLPRIDETPESAKKVEQPRNAKTEENMEEEGEESDGGSGSDDEEDEEGEGDSEFMEKRPRGHRHEDKDAKKERKKAVKAEAKEKRKTKMPKAEKKRLVKKKTRS